jgi:hypothetical protein
VTDPTAVFAAAKGSGDVVVGVNNGSLAAAAGWSILATRKEGGAVREWMVAVAQIGPRRRSGARRRQCEEKGGNQFVTKYEESVGN